MESKLGQLIDETAQRDAIHIAIAPVIADKRLLPGDEVGFVESGNTELVGPIKPAVGIVDPFLTAPVLKGQRFWLCLFPSSVTGMRHHWNHPSFGVAENTVHIPEVDAIKKAKEVIQSEADSAGLDYEEIMQAAKDYIDHDDYLCEGGRWDGHYLSDDFWPAYETVTGEKVNERKRGSFFSCSC